MNLKRMNCLRSVEKQIINFTRKFLSCIILRITRFTTSDFGNCSYLRLSMGRKNSALMNRKLIEDIYCVRHSLQFIHNYKSDFYYISFHRMALTTSSSSKIFKNSSIHHNSYYLDPSNVGFGYPIFK